MRLSLDFQVGRWKLNAVITYVRMLRILLNTQPDGGRDPMWVRVWK